MEYLNKLMLMKAGFSNIEIPSDISCQKDCPTYLRKFIGNNQIDFIYKHIDVEEDLSITVDTLDFNHTSESLDGNPLKLELADESFNDVMVEYKSAAKVQLWHKSEAKHGFMLRKDSILIMNNFLSKWNNQNDYQWIWFLVDAKDYILFGSRHLNGWWFNARVKPMPSVLYNDINLNVLLENYIKQHKLEYNDVTVNVSVEYDLRSNDIETFDEENLSVPPPMKLLAYWNELSLTIPLSGKTILRQDLSVGSESKSKHLWNELCIVQELYDLIKKHQNTSSDMIYKIIMPSSSDPDLYVPVEEKLQEMLHQDHDYDIEPAEEIQSFNRIVFNGRLHLSFCDKIWTILKDVSCYSQLVKCFNIIFSTIAHGKVNIQTEENTNTRLESLVYDVFHHRAAIPHLSGLQPLELLLEAGVEKLCKDYIYFFETYKLYHNKLPFYEIPKETSSNIAYSMMKPRLTIPSKSSKAKVFNSSLMQ
ncbi:protein zwilch-like [Ctenocephalides felis]|uniref:protein zwilch-like n=1 Tax=Ctenocephalides felis TaxID=7515 RepID=UPI000E6E4D77|nr:protein zwilch-like [Ctenocephalides felis]